MTTTPQASKADVLHAFSAEANINADTLAKYLKLYPQFRESLVDLSIELYSAPSFDEIVSEDVSSPNAKQAWSKFQSMLNASDPAAVTYDPVENPLSGLSDQRFREVARELNISRLFLSRLRDCTLEVATIPKQFLHLLADALKLTADQLQTALDAPPKIAQGQSYKSMAKPRAQGKITFDDALTQSGLSEEQQKILRSMRD
jgi:hypothetical protein